MAQEMLDALVAAVAAALTSRVAEGVAGAGQRAWSVLLRSVREKIGSNPSVLAALDADPAARR